MLKMIKMIEHDKMMILSNGWRVGVGWTFVKSTLKWRRIEVHMKLPDSYRKSVYERFCYKTRGKAQNWNLEPMIKKLFRNFWNFEPVKTYWTTGRLEFLIK